MLHVWISTYMDELVIDRIPFVSGSLYGFGDSESNNCCFTVKLRKL